MNLQAKSLLDNTADLASKAGAGLIEAAQGIDFVANFVNQWAEVHTWCPAPEAVLHLRARKVVKHHLHHGEFI